MNCINNPHLTEALKNYLQGKSKTEFGKQLHLSNISTWWERGIPNERVMPVLKATKDVRLTLIAITEITGVPLIDLDNQHLNSLSDSYILEQKENSEDEQLRPKLVEILSGNLFKQKDELALELLEKQEAIYSSLAFVTLAMQEAGISEQDLKKADKERSNLYA